MEGLKVYYSELVKLAKEMKEVIRLSKDLAFVGHPVVDKWVDRVANLSQKLDDIYPYRSFAAYSLNPSRTYVFDILTYLRRLLKEENLFFEMLVK